MIHLSSYVIPHPHDSFISACVLFQSFFEKNSFSCDIAFVFTCNFVWIKTDFWPEPSPPFIYFHTTDFAWHFHRFHLFSCFIPKLINFQVIFQTFSRDPPECDSFPSNLFIGTFRTRFIRFIHSSHFLTRMVMFHAGSHIVDVCCHFSLRRSTGV